MLIEQLIDLENVRTDNLKFRTDLRDRVMDQWLASNTVDDCLPSQIAQKIFTLKIKARPVNAGHPGPPWPSNIAFHLRPIWLQTLVAMIDSESCQTSFPSFCAAVGLESEQTPCPQTGRISFATNLAANFGCYRFRIMPDIVSKLLRSAI